MFTVNLGDYFRVAILCDKIDKNRRHCTMISPGLGRETDGGGQETGSDLNGDKFSSLFPCEAPVYCTVCVRPIRGPDGLGIDQSEASSWVVFQILFVYFHTREPDSQGTEKTSPIINIRLSPKYFCDSQILFFPD